MTRGSGQYIYTVYDNSTIRRKWRFGASDGEEIIVRNGTIDHFCPTDARLYWTEGSTLYMRTREPGNFFVAFRNLSGVPNSVYAVKWNDTTDRVFFNTGTEIGYVPVTRATGAVGDTVSLITNGSNLRGMCANPDTNSMYYFTNSTLIQRTPSTGFIISEQIATLEPDATDVNAILSDGENVYWFENCNQPFGGCIRTTIRRCPEFGGATILMADLGSSGIVPIGQSADYLYFGAVQRLNKDAVFDRPNLQWSGGTGFIDVIQSIQNPSNTVKLVAERQTRVRVHARSDETRYANAVLHGRVTGGAALPGSPLRAKTEYRFVGNDTTDRSDPNAGFQYILPREWTEAGGVEFRAVLDPGNAIAEDDETDNDTGWFGFVFRSKPPICIKAMPVKTTAGISYVGDNGFWDTIDRGETLVAAPRLIVHAVPGLSYESCIIDWGCTTEWEVNDDDGSIISDIADHDALDWIECPGAKVVNMGMIHPASGWNWGGLARESCRTFLVNMSATTTPEDGFAQPFAGIAVAHEIGHLFGFDHVRCPAGANFRGGFDSNYPFDPCQFGVSSSFATVGYDWYSRQAITGDAAGSYMDYQGMDWVSEYHWNRQYDQLNAFSRFTDPPTTGHILWVQGEYRPVEGDGSIVRARNLDRGLFALGNVESLWSTQLDVMEASGPTHVLLALDASDDVLFSTPFGITNECCDVASTPRRFTVVSPSSPDVRALRVVSLVDGSVVASLDASPNPPSVDAITQPAAGQTFADVFTVAWQASDPDADALTFQVQYSNDDGSTWQTLAANLYGESFTTEAGQVPVIPGSEGADGSRIRVIASDGLNTDSFESLGFNVPDRDPMAVIAEPKHDQHFLGGEQIVLRSRYFDPEDGDVPAALDWTIGASGGGAPVFSASNVTDDWLIVPAGLEPGIYTVTLVADDSAGNSIAESVTIRVDEFESQIPIKDTDADGVPDDVDNCPFVPNADQADFDGDGFGDVCDVCPINAGSQADGDGDGLGDECDPCPVGALLSIGTDGEADANFDGAVTVQTAATSAGDNADPSSAGADGAELDALYAAFDCDRLHLLIAGNVVPDTSVVHVFFGVGGGQDELLENGDVALLEDLQGLGLEFEASHWIGIEPRSLGGGMVGLDGFSTELTGTGTSEEWMLGTADADSDGRFFGGDAGAPDIRITYDNRNIAGVIAGTGASSGAGVTTGLELEIPFEFFDGTFCALDVTVVLTRKAGSVQVLTNQVLPPAPAGPALGLPFDVDLGVVPGAQSLTLARRIATDPVVSLVDAGQTLQLRTDVLYDGPYTVQWQRDGFDLPDGGTVSGAQSPVLRLAPTGPGDAGVYRVVVTTTCGVFTSGSVVVGSPNDACVSAAPLGLGTTFGSFLGTTPSGVPGCADGRPDLWYAYTAMSSGELSVDTCGTSDFPSVDAGVDTSLSLHAGCGGTFIVCNTAGACAADDAGQVVDASFSYAMEAGETVYVRVVGGSPDDPGAGWFVLNTGFEPGCVADRTGDGEVDISDLLSYLSEWLTLDPAAELDGIEGISITDLLTYLDAWFDARFEGC